MRIIQNETISFRLPNVLRETLEEVAVNNDMHLSQLIREACLALVRVSNDRRGDHAKTGNQQ
jgi:hypothetical protein